MGRDTNLPCINVFITCFLFILLTHVPRVMTLIVVNNDKG